MEFKFEANQEYQVNAVDAVVDLFEGQPHGKVELTFSLGSGFAASPNRLDLDEAALLQNLQSTQQANGLTVDAETDRLQGETPIHLVQATRPIPILDEPQNMESELRVKALSALNPLFALRYSATHRNPYNLIYRLTPFDAYRQGLVKRIEVASVVQENDANQGYLKLIQTTTATKKVP